MIETRTVFVLGAGASIPYGYPSGAGLKDRICSEFIRDIEKFHDRDPEARNSMKRFFDKRAEFVDSFKRSRVTSIDRWLLSNTDCSEIGKLAIANSIIRCESPDMLFPSRDIDWFTVLFNEIIKEAETPEQCSLTKIGFITFNYDRLLEHLFYESFTHTYRNIEKEKIDAALKELQIYHIYGAIENPPWQKGISFNYGSQYKFDFINPAKDRIRVIGERIDSSLGNIHDLLSKADRIFFLGFGFDPQNLKMLRASDIFPMVSEIYGTAYTFYDNEIADVLKRTNHNAKIEPCESVELLRKYFIGRS